MDMKTALLYFSGTGNTAYVAQYIGEGLSTSNEVEICPMEESDNLDIAQFDALIAGFPIYACQMPGFVQDRLQSLKSAVPKPVYLFCTSVPLRRYKSARAL